MDLLLNLAIWLPLAGAVLIAVLPGNADRSARWIAAVISGVALLLALALAWGYDPNAGVASPLGLTSVPWIPQLGIGYVVGLDGLSLPMFVLNALLVFLAVLISWNTTLRPREYFALVLALETAVAGVFSALDFILFFLFWELELAPMFLLIGIWGGARREYAAMKFILYTVAGSAFMLLGIFILYLASPAHTFDMLQLGSQRLAPAVQSLIWILLFIGFAVKVPIFPLHTWLPDAHTEAPTAISVLLAGVLLKMGAYGILRANFTLLPDATHQFALLLGILAVINIVYGALVAMVQGDLKRVIANSSISHMGYVLLGASSLTAIGIQGAVFQMFTHGTITGLLFIMVGLIYDRTHTRAIADLGGLAARMPKIAAIFIVAALASLGLPGLSGFVSEFLVFLGSFPVWGVQTILGVFTIVLTAGYMLWVVERVLFGPERPEWAHLGDATGREMFAVGVLVAVIVLIGVFPAVLGNVVIAGTTPIALRY
ncbi:MAG: NADH-quinone oxidoreductase subunit [Chloroflexota bacterium]|jgi:NADH-quinone oxidoreductase subunit M|nr:NADH-quinone oxidoreductase subunit [Chloroflexota bacterium]